MSDLRGMLREATSTRHEALDLRVLAHRPFGSRARYAALVRAHHALFATAAPFYCNATLRGWIPGLSVRDRTALAAQDLEHLGAGPATPLALENSDPECGLGWLYVIEVSNMGGAVLARQAQQIWMTGQHGARHLAPAAEGAAPHWRTLVEALNAVPITEDGVSRAIGGAMAAFAAASLIIEREFAAISAAQDGPQE